jgi:hypothetical protein
LIQRYKNIWTKNKAKKTKAKRSTREREHSLNDKSENWSIFGNEKRSVSSPKEICWGPTIYCSKQNKRKLKTKVKTLQEKRIVYEAIKI